ncbi:hypothetical protein LDENG_00284390, partial [Lucifuga dentata]
PLADCKYRFSSWGECDPTSGSRTRTGTLKKALYDAECQQAISVSKPCAGKPQTRSKGERRMEIRFGMFSTQKLCCNTVWADL